MGWISPSDGLRSGLEVTDTVDEQTTQQVDEAADDLAKELVLSVILAKLADSDANLLTRLHGMMVGQIEGSFSKPMIGAPAESAQEVLSRMTARASQTLDAIFVNAENIRRNSF